MLLIPRCRRVGLAARKGDPPPGAVSVRAQENIHLLDPFLAGPLGLDPQTLDLYVYSIRLCHLVSIDRTGDPSTQFCARVPLPKNGDVPKKSSPYTAGATSARPVTRRHGRLPHPRRGLLASSLDLRCTRKSALALPPGKLRSAPPSFGCSAGIRVRTGTFLRTLHPLRRAPRSGTRIRGSQRPGTRGDAGGSTRRGDTPGGCR